MPTIGSRAELMRAVGLFVTGMLWLTIPVAAARGGEPAKAGSKADVAEVESLTVLAVDPKRPRTDQMMRSYV
ncbi:MAG: hypothetical protein ACYTG0_40115, partial [Planctomycetota bacterium]